MTARHPAPDGPRKRYTKAAILAAVVIAVAAVVVVYATS